MHTQNLSMHRGSESHVIHIPSEDKIVKFYWELTEEEIERYAALHNYIADLGEGKVHIEVKNEKNTKKYEIILEVLKLNGESLPCSYLFHKSGGKKRVKRKRQVLAVEQKYIEGGKAQEFEQYFKEDLSNSFKNLGLQFDIDWLTTANFRVIQEGENTFRFVITDLSTNIKSLIIHNKNFIDGILAKNTSNYTS